MNYYRVTAKCGHVGNGMFTLKSFYVKADSKKDAKKMVREMPRVKKGQRECVVDVHRITYNAYLDGMDEWHSDPYFKCRTPEDMRKVKGDGYRLKKQKMSGRFDGKIFIKKPKKYERRNCTKREEMKSENFY